jgi:hypothetical protein
LDAPPPPPAAVVGVLDGVVLDGLVLDDDDEPTQAASATTAINMPARTPIRAFLNRPRAGPRRAMESRWLAQSELLSVVSRWLFVS